MVLGSSFALMSSRAPILPPLDITLPETLAFHEKHNADYPVYVFSKDGQNGFTEVSYRQFVRASHRVPQLSRITFDPSAKAVVAILAHTDTLLYHTIVLGLMRAGAVPFPISPRNTAAAVVNLLKKTSCHYLLATRTTLNTLLESIEIEMAVNDPTYSLSIGAVPVLGQLYSEFSDELASHVNSSVGEISAEYKFAPNDVGIYLHSSGSTGMPKAIPITHGDIINFIRFPTANIYRGCAQPVKMACMGLPAFHAMGFVFQAVVPFFLGTIIAVFPPVVENTKAVPMLPNPDNLIAHTERTKSNGIFTIPAFLHVWAHEKHSVEVLRNLDVVAFGGGALGPQVAEILSGSGLKLRTVYGGTEFGVGGIAGQRDGDEVDWDYVEINPNNYPQFIPQGDGTYELQMICPDDRPRTVVNIPGSNGYATSDLFVRHPSKEHLWKFAGRLDDVLIHSSGEKTVPQPMEDIIMGSPYIHGVVVFGQARDQPGVLIEPTSEYAIDVKDMSAVARFRNLIWPVVDQANRIAPAFSKIFKEMILIASTAKSLPKTPKGTVLKKGAVLLYAKEIEAIYSNVDAILATDLTKPPLAWDKESISQWLVDQARELGPEKLITRTGNLFEQGLDSLSATILRRRITSALNSHKTHEARAALELITQNTIYSYPTVDALVKFLSTALADPQSAGSSATQAEVIEEMIEKYRFDGQVSEPRDNKHDNSIVVLITGSTGYLGSHVLEGLLRDQKVTKIYALNRPSGDGRSSAERHLRRFRDKGLDEALLASTKLIHIASDYSQENLGVPESTYNELRDSVNAVIHVAWRLDFNLSLSSFESNVRGTRNLAALARAGPHAASTKFIFTSSVGVAQAWDQSIGPYPEEILSDAKVAVGSGYGEAKYVSERILATSGLNVTSVRIGQITGTEENGAWATTDWVPILVKSSLAMGALPSAKGDISWLSSNAVASTILDLMAYDGGYPEAMNIVHPKCITWNSAMGYMQEALQKECNASVPLIPFKEWFAILDKHSNQSSNDEMMKIPAIKLHSFFRQLSAGDLAVSPFTSQSFSMAEFATGKMRSISKTLASFPPLTKEHPFKWIKYWKDEGLFN